MFNGLFGKKETKEDIRKKNFAEMIIEHINSKYGEDITVQKSDLYTDDDGIGHFYCLCTAPSLNGRTFEVYTRRNDDELSEYNDGYICAKYADRIKACADEILDQVFSHYTSAVDCENLETDDTKWDSVPDFDLFLKPDDDCDDISVTVVTDLDHDEVGRLLPKLLELMKKRDIRLDVLVSIVGPDMYETMSKAVISGDTSDVCRNYYAFVNYMDEPEDLEVIKNDETD